MEAVREWAVTICAAAVLCAAVSGLAPESRLTKGLGIVLAAVMLSALASLAAAVGDIKIDTEKLSMHFFAEESELNDLVERQTADAVEDAVRRLIARRLESNGISAEDIRVETDISDDGCISIGQVTVITAGTDEAHRRETAELLSDMLGINAEVAVSEE